MISAIEHIPNPAKQVITTDPNLILDNIDFIRIKGNNTTAVVIVNEHIIVIIISFEIFLGISSLIYF
jgi:hypothetical protein